jgi:hypothetical protein
MSGNVDVLAHEGSFRPGATPVLSAAPIDVKIATEFVRARVVSPSRVFLQLDVVDEESAAWLVVQASNP